MWSFHHCYLSLLCPLSFSAPQDKAVCFTLPMYLGRIQCKRNKTAQGNPTSDSLLGAREATLSSLLIKPYFATSVLVNFSPFFTLSINRAPFTTMPESSYMTETFVPGIE